MQGGAFPKHASITVKSRNIVVVVVYLLNSVLNGYETGIDELESKVSQRKFFLL